jgi:outer membrane protein TolC
LESFAKNSIKRSAKSLQLTTLVFAFGMITTPHSSLAATWADIRTKAQKAPSIISAHLDVESAMTGVDASRAGFFPRVFSSLQANRSRDEQYKFTRNSFSAALTLEQTLFSSGRDQANYEAASASLEAAQFSLKEASAALRSELSKAWNRALFYDHLAILNQETINRRQSNLQIVKLRYASGRESKGSLLLTENAEQRAKVEYKDAARKSEIARRDLGVLAGMEISESEPLSGNLADDTWKPPTHATSRDLKIVINQARLNAAVALSNAAHAKYLPELSLNATAKKSASPDLPLKEPLYSAGITMAIPIFDGRKSADQRAAIIKKNLLEIELTQSKLQSDQTIRTALANFEIARERLIVARKGLEATKLQAEVSRQRYTLGLMSFQDWDAFESALIKAELEVLTLEKELADAISEYLGAIGITLEENL